jgi:hypothetical protein
MTGISTYTYTLVPCLSLCPCHRQRPPDYCSAPGAWPVPTLWHLYADGQLPAQPALPAGCWRVLPRVYLLEPLFLQRMRIRYSSQAVENLPGLQWALPVSTRFPWKWLTSRVSPCPAGNLHLKSWWCGHHFWSGWGRRPCAAFPAVLGLEGGADTLLAHAWLGCLFVNFPGCPGSLAAQQKRLSVDDSKRNFQLDPDANSNLLFLHLALSLYCQGRSLGSQRFPWLSSLGYTPSPWW